MSFHLFGHLFALREPRLLWLAAALGLGALGLWLWRACPKPGLGGRRGAPWAAVAVRALAFLAFAVALAQPLVARPALAGATVFVVDRSRSMGGDRARAVEAQLRAAVAADAGREPLGLVAFAGQATVVYPAGALPADPDAAIRALDAADVGPTDDTDIAGALGLAEAVAGEGGKHLVLFTDGRETLGRAADWAADARARGVVVDVLAPDGQPWRPDARLSGLTVPPSTWQGGTVDVGAVVASDAPGQATVAVSVDGRAAGRQQVALQPGATNVQFTLPPPAPGYHTIAVTLQPAGADAVAENNALAATTVVRDKPRVLIVEGQQFAGDRLRRALEGTGSDVTVRAPATLTGRLADLAPFDAIVLVDVPASALSQDDQQALRDFARTLGHGLVVTGGTTSFGQGGYQGSALEDALPVRVKPRGEGKRPPAALLLVIDRSYSMNFPDTGPTKILMAKTAAAEAVRALAPGDQVAVLAFGDDNEWITHLRTIDSQSDIDDVVRQISSLTADGQTEMYDALAAGIDELSKSPLRTRHMVLLSDGEPTTRFNVDAVTGQLRTAGVTLSTIAIGADADKNLMQQLATGGNGRYSYAASPDEIPRLTLQEAQQLGGQTLATGAFQPVQTAPSPILRDLDVASLPQLDGYDITEVKPGAQVILASNRDEPVLAQWQYGLGRVVAWTSDLSQNLAPDWHDADAYAPFWNQAVRWTLAAATSHTFRVQTAPDGRDLVVTVDAFDASGAPVDLADTQATLHTPDGASVPLALPQAAPGVYQVRLASPRPGAYELELTQARPGGPTRDVDGFAVPYPAELGDTTVDGAALAAIAGATGGRVLPDAAAAFAGRTPATGARFQPLWPWFAALGLGLFLLDIALRLRHAATPADRLRRLLPR